MVVTRDASNDEETTPLLTGHHHSQAAASTDSGSSPSTRVNSEDLDARFKRWLDYIARRNPKKGKTVSALEKSPQFLVSVFEKQEDEPIRKVRPGKERWDGFIDEDEFINQLSAVKVGIGKGIEPKMIQTGSSGSYFIRACVNSKGSVIGPLESPEIFDEAVKEQRIKIVAVFKPNDEEPYGNLNPKRVFLRRYLWWAMGRPCLIPSFSYISEVGASLLDERLQLNLVPSTRLVELSSTVFSYAPKERQRKVLREKIGSYQNFLYGYVNVSTFLRAHPWPSRPRDLLEQDLEAENHAHGRARARARKGKGTSKSSKSRSCMNALHKFNCFTSASFTEEEEGAMQSARQSLAQEAEEGSGFMWTKELMQDFRLELEKLVCFDYLMRNTDRGLDNFMVKVEQVTPSSLHPSGWQLTLAAIDNSLAFPWKHPAGIRSYPWGWLYLPTDLIGGNFSPHTRQAFIPFLSSASWWNDTKQELETLFRKDDHFDEKKFQGQMEVLRGQGWNLLESLRSEEEGPLELCARQKQMVKQDTSIVEEATLTSYSRTARVPLTSAAQVIENQLRYSTESTTTTTTNGQTSVAAVARPVPTKGKELAPSSPDAIQPRSLPETIDEEQISHRWNQASVIDGISGISRRETEQQSSNETLESKVIGKAYRGKSLGIDVLTEIDKSTSKAKRPNLRKALTGHVGGTRGGRIKKERRRQIGQDVLSEAESERGDNNLEDSIASLPDSTQPPPFLKANRRRNGSVGDNWSISSVFDRSNSNEHIEVETRKVQVIVERLEPDDGIAWQTWLGLQ